jgi:signal transduction histidine kinase
MEAKDTAEEANRVKSRFLFNLSHEIRTPMNGIISYGEAILNTTSLVQAQHFAQIMLQESEILHRMIGDLLDHAKLEAGKLELDPQPICLPELADNITSTSTCSPTKRGCATNAAWSPAPPNMCAPTSCDCAR